MTHRYCYQGWVDFDDDHSFKPGEDGVDRDEGEEKLEFALNTLFDGNDAPCSDSIETYAASAVKADGLDRLHWFFVEALQDAILFAEKNGWEAVGLQRALDEIPR